MAAGKTANGDWSAGNRERLRAYGDGRLAQKRPANLIKNHASWGADVLQGGEGLKDGRI